MGLSYASPFIRILSDSPEATLCLPPERMGAPRRGPSPVQRKEELGASDKVSGYAWTIRGYYGYTLASQVPTI